MEEQTKTKRYSISELALKYGVTNDAIRLRAKVRKLKPFTEEGSKRFLYDQEQEAILFTPFHQVIKDAEVEIIYVTRETHFFESKMNFLPLDKLPEWDNKI